MKNILVLAGGGDNDEAVFATALAAAQPFHAHLEFLHVQIGPGEAAAWEPHAEFLRGPAIRETIQRLRTEAVMRTASAKSHFEQFCDVHKIVVSDQPLGIAVSANWREEIGDAERRLMFSARHHDLVVLGRRTGLNGLPPDLIERILLGCGRPLLIAPPQPPPPCRHGYGLLEGNTGGGARSRCRDAAPGQCGSRRSRRRRRTRCITGRRIGRSFASASMARHPRRGRLLVVDCGAGTEGAADGCPVA